MGSTCLSMVLLAFSITKTSTQSSYEYEPFQASRIQSRHINGYSGGQFIPFRIDSRMDSVTSATGELGDTRAQATSHYRNFYRNRNYFVQSTDQSRAASNGAYHPNREDSKVSSSGIVRQTTFPTTGIGLPGYKRGNVDRTTRSHFETADSTRLPERYIRTHWTLPEEKPVQPTPSLADVTIPSASDDPILFGPTTSRVQYIRPAHLQSSNVATPTSSSNDLGKGARSKGKYLPSLDNKVEPQCSDNSGYCEVFDKYPGQLVNEIVSRTFTPDKFQQVYGETTDNSSKVTDLKAIILERTALNSGAPIEETPLCSSVEHTIYPKVAKNKDNKWLYIVNHDEYIQGVRVEKCLDEGTSCFFGDAAPAGYQTACRQKFIYKKLLALNPEGKTSTDTFRLPSCCVCFVKTATISDRLLGLVSNPEKHKTSSPPTTHFTHSKSPSTEGLDGIDFQADEVNQNSTARDL